MFAHQKKDKLGIRYWCEVGFWRYLKAKIKMKSQLHCGTCGQFVSVKDVFIL